MKVRARVYEKDGNRFLIPGHWYSDDDDAIGMGSASAVMCESMMFSVVCGMKADEWLEMEGDNSGLGQLEHYLTDMIGSQFAHGGVTVMLIGGPLFDENHKEAVRTGKIPS